MAGRPPFYDTPEDLEKAVQLYFESLDKYNNDGKLIYTKTPTVAGLAYHLGFEDRQSIYDQKNRNEQFSCILKKAVLFIESVHEENLVTGKSATGSIFWLKNHNWQDVQNINASTVSNVIDTSKLSQEKQDALADALIDIFNPKKDDE
jgi:hypothetical protein